MSCVFNWHKVEFVVSLITLYIIDKGTLTSVVFFLSVLLRLFLLPAF